MFLTMLGDIAVFWRYVTLICSFFYITLTTPLLFKPFLEADLTRCSCSHSRPNIRTSLPRTVLKTFSHWQSSRLHSIQCRLVLSSHM